MLDSRRSTAQNVGPTHYALMALVLANLAFVQLTEAAAPLYLLPLYGLTLLSPMLARLREKMLYRAGWNLLVIGFFGMLVRHALDRQLSSVLEDGLVLAVLCQVHLLNNLREGQRPDLLILNSYLIAVITGYLTVDMGFAGAFLLFVPFFVLGLVLQTVRAGSGRIAPEELGPMVRDAGMRAGFLVVMAVVAFFLCPRDFEREALLARYLNTSTSGERSRIDFSNELDLSPKGKVDPRSETVCTIELLEGSGSSVPRLLRGATLSVTGAEADWSQAKRPLVRSGPVADPLWRLDGGGRSMRRGLALGARVEAKIRIERLSSATDRLFLPREAAAVVLGSGADGAELRPLADGTAHVTERGPVTYDVLVGMPRVTGAEGASDRDRQRFLRLQPTIHNRSAIDLARRLKAQLRPKASDRDVATHLARSVQSRAPYLLPGEPGSATNLHDFLTTSAGGHCEFFASALATMLRSVGVPARVVTGYRVDPPASVGSVTRVSSSHAHAWVEAFLGSSGWVTFDPTPAAESTEGGAGAFARWREELGVSAQELWNKVTGFDGDGRVAVGDWLAAAPGRALALLRARPGITTLLALLVVAGVWRVERRRRGRGVAAVQDLERALRAAGLEREPGETPRELLARAVAASLDENVLRELDEAITTHEVARYSVRRTPQTVGS